MKLLQRMFVMAILLTAVLPMARSLRHIPRCNDDFHFF
jgi:hypothetical protein